MTRMFLLLVGFVLVAGCKQPSSDPPQPAPGTDAEIDFATWPLVTDQPIEIEPVRWMFCRAPTTEEQRVWEAEKKTHGPHYHRAIVVRTNPEALAAFRSGADMPLGTVVVKEKHPDFQTTGPPTEYGAMVKREAGYDAAHADWEYVYVIRQPEKRVSRGPLESCIRCHSIRKDTDYLFRSYLPKP